MAPTQWRSAFNSQHIFSYSEARPQEETALSCNAYSASSVQPVTTDYDHVSVGTLAVRNIGEMGVLC